MVYVLRLVVFDLFCFGFIIVMMPFDSVYYENAFVFWGFELQNWIAFLIFAKCSFRISYRIKNRSNVRNEKNSVKHADLIIKDAFRK